jgi:LL-diaminopimelate aminotransferase
MGSPDLAPDPSIVQSFIRTSQKDESHGYQPHKGTRGLREAWAHFYQREYNVELDPDTDILPLIGSKEGIFHLMQTYIQPGDIVLVPDPAYLSYKQAALFAGGEIETLPLKAENQFLPELKKIESALLDKTKAIWLNYPNNPTTAVATIEFFKKVIEFGTENNILVCHDAAYTQVTFDGTTAPSILAIDGAKNTAVEFNSLSKSHNMAGWRTGTMAGNPEVIKTTFKLKSNVDSGHFLPIIDGSIEAMRGDQKWKTARNEKYRERRDIVLRYLKKFGLSAQTPQATIYIWSEIPEGWKSVEFVNSVLENTGVSLAPGTIFGVYGEGYIRIALTQPLNRIITAMERLKEWIDI